jgi:hypothetical protein
MLYCIEMTSAQFTALHIMGIIFGWIVVAGIVMSAMNYLVKAVNRRYIMELPADSNLRRHYPAFMRGITRVHGYIGLYMVTILGLHFFSELGHHGFNLTGIISLTLMMTQIGLGSYGVLIKNRKRGRWFYAHRAVASLLVAAVIVHIASVLIWPPQ